MKTPPDVLSLFVRILATSCALAAWNGLAAQVLSLKVANETAPPGGTAQVKVFVTEPKPISTGWTDVEYDSFVYPTVDGIALAPGLGDISGAAVVADGRMRMSLSSPLGSAGMNIDYPLLTIAMSVRADAPHGRVMKLALGPESWWRDPLGNVYTWEAKAGTLVVGGTVAIHNIVPGGSDLPTGATVRILGMGFQPGVSVRIEDVQLNAVRYINGGEVQVVLDGPAHLSGKRVRLSNPDGSSDLYYSYLRGVPVGRSANALLASAYPIFPGSAYTGGVFGPVAFDGQGAGTVIGAAFQNPQLTPVTISLSLLPAHGNSVKSSSLSLDSGARIWRTVSELFTDPVPAGAYLQVSASAPIQMMGLVGDQATGAVWPAQFAH